MKKFLLLGTLALFAMPVLPALAVPTCDGPDFSAVDDKGRPINDEIGLAEDYERQLRGEGIHGHNTRWWNGCLQTFVRIDGRDVMKFYDPNTLREVAVN